LNIATLVSGVLNCLYHRLDTEPVPAKAANSATSGVRHSLPSLGTSPNISNTSFHDKIRSKRMPFGKEDVYRVTVAHRYFEFLCMLGKIHGCGFGLMYATEINRQMPINEYKYIVVTRKGEYLIA
jgi:hypothetical protein